MLTDYKYENLIFFAFLHKKTDIHANAQISVLISGGISASHTFLNTHF